MSVFKKRRFTIKRKRKQEAQSEEPAESQSTHNAAPEIKHLPMMEGEMPTFFHIGQLAKECLTAGYKIGSWHFDCTSKANDNISFQSFGTGKPGFHHVSGGIGISEKFGIFSSSQLWQKEGILGTLGMQPRIWGGIFKAMLRATFTSESRYQGKLDVSSGYDHPPFRADVVVPILNEDKLMGYVIVEPLKNCLLGYRAVYDVTNKSLDKHVLGVGYNNDSTEVGLKFVNFKTLNGTIFQRLDERWAFALTGSLYGEEEKHFAIACQCNVNDSTLLKAMVGDDGYLGLVYKATLGKGLDIMYHVGVDTRAPISGDHKIGISWSLKG